MISVTILTKNSGRYLKEVLENLKDFKEVVIFDNGSTDNTFEIARSFPNVSLFQGLFIGFGATHNVASSLAKGDWILSIDSDEIVTQELAQEILNLRLDKTSVYSFPRHNEFNGKWIKWCGWYPDRQIRLYHRKMTCFSDVEVHEAVITKGLKEVKLKHPLRHYSYEKTADFLAKMQSYSDLFAKQYMGKKRSSPLKATMHALFAFLKSYLIKKGFLGGFEGFLISSYNAQTAFYKYLKLYEANKKLEQDK